MRTASLMVGCIFALAGVCSAEWHSHLDTAELPKHRRDRGTGLPLSSFGTYIQQGQLIVYPFFEYYYDHDSEYSPNELGQTLDKDFKGKYTASEVLIFLAYGFTDRFAIELEAAYIDATLEKSPDDPTPLANKTQESGIGDVEGQLRWRWNKESETRPEFFTYFETVGPTADKGSLIGTSDWQFKLGSGLVRGYSWGTVTARGAMEYDLSEEKIALGEVALEYLRRLNDRWRAYVGFEGTQDEVELLTEAQWHVSRHAFVKLNSGFGITPKATDWAPEVGVLFSF